MRSDESPASRSAGESHKDVRVRLTILLADGNTTTQNLGKRILTDAGYDVVTVGNGIAAGRKIAELHPDIALLDVYLPGYTGLEICEKMRATLETVHIPVLLTVAKVEPFQAEDAIKVKADGVILKPFEAEDLIAVVEILTRGVPAGTRGAATADNP